MPIGLFLRAALGGLGKWLSGLNFWQAVCIALALLASVQTVRLSAEKRHSAKVEAQLRKAIEGREDDRRRYAQAQKDAAAENRAQISATEAESRQISEETKSAYQRDLARLRADADRRLREAGAAKGSAGSAGASAPPAPAQGADADGLRLSPDEHLQASEIELRLMHLQNWVERQLQVDPNK